MTTSRDQLMAPPSDGDENEGVSISIKIPDLKIQKTLNQNLTDTIWSSKQQILDTIASKLEDGINYGIFSPPSNGKSGKFLEEERCWKEYSPRDRKAVEVIYKRRIYKDMVLNSRKVKEVNSRSGQKKFLSCLKAGHVEKLSKLLEKGLDPNFHDKESGETPFTLAVATKQTAGVLTTLVEGGAHLDFRTRAGHTPLHRAAQTGNKKAIQTLLSFGSSPNHKDSKGFTPLYLSVCNDTPADCSELLLREYALHGVTDQTGWTEAHQACKRGLHQHLQHLIFYGANVNMRNSSGNTPLHICAILKQEECARLLLFRGADKTLVNFANQDPVSAAVVAGNQSMANLIRSYKPEDVVRVQEVPQYNTKRRTIVWQSQQSTLLRQRRFSHSTPQLHQLDQVLTRPGLPWMETQTPNPDGESGSDSDSQSSIQSEISDSLEGDSKCETPGAIYDMKKRWRSEHLDSTTHGSLDRLQIRSIDGTDPDVQSIRSASPYAHLYRKKIEEEDLKTASIRSYPKRLTPSIFQEGVFQDFLHSAELKPVSSPTSSVLSPKYLMPTMSLPVEDSFHGRTSFTFSEVEKTGSFSNLRSDNGTNIHGRASPGKANPLLFPPPGVLPRQREFGSTNELLLPENQVRSPGHERSQDVRKNRGSAPPARDNFRDYGSMDDLLKKESGNQVSNLPKGGNPLTKEFSPSNSDDVTEINQIQSISGTKESVWSYGSADDLDSSSLRSLPLSDKEEEIRSSAKIRQFGSADDLLNSDQPGSGRSGVEPKPGIKVSPSIPVVNSQGPQKRLVLNSNELLRKFENLETSQEQRTVVSQPQRNTSHVGQRDTSHVGQRDTSHVGQRNTSHVGQSRDSTLAFPSASVFNDDRSVFRSNSSIVSNASHGSTTNLRNSLIAEVLKRRQVADIDSQGRMMKTHEMQSQFKEIRYPDDRLDTQDKRHELSSFKNSQSYDDPKDSKLNTLKSDLRANTVDGLTYKDRQNTRSGQPSESETTSANFTQRAEEVLNTLRRQDHPKTQQQNHPTIHPDVQPVSRVLPPTPGGTSPSVASAVPLPPPPPPPPPPSLTTSHKVSPHQQRDPAEAKVEVTRSADNNATSTLKVKPQSPNHPGGGLTGLAGLVAERAMERERKRMENDGSSSA